MLQPFSLAPAHHPQLSETQPGSAHPSAIQAPVASAGLTPRLPALAPPTKVPLAPPSNPSPQMWGAPFRLKLHLPILSPRLCLFHCCGQAARGFTACLDPHTSGGSALSSWSHSLPRPSHPQTWGSQPSPPSGYSLHRGTTSSGSHQEQPVPTSGKTQRPEAPRLTPACVSACGCQCTCVTVCHVVSECVGFVYPLCDMSCGVGSACVRVYVSGHTSSVCPVHAHSHTPRHTLDVCVVTV